MTTFETEQAVVDLTTCMFLGRTLDVGGGGEGIVSRFTADTVVIDVSRQELEKTPDRGLKIVMDASDMKFLDHTFHTVTAFYSLMYMTRDTVTRAAAEMYRVLKYGGAAVVFDTEIPAPGADVFVKQLQCILPDEVVTVGYGVSWTRSQTKDEIADIFTKCGFSLSESIGGGGFRLTFVKKKPPAPSEAGK